MESHVHQALLLAVSRLARAMISEIVVAIAIELGSAPTLQEDSRSSLQLLQLLHG